MSPKRSPLSSCSRASLPTAPHWSWSRHGWRPPEARRRIDMADPASTSAPIILVPGFWLGAWAWDEVASILRADGHDVTALTLPGLESGDADRSAITLSD